MDDLQHPKKEISTYEKARVLGADLEAGILDPLILSKIIRKRELEIIGEVLQSASPTIILDCGCGSGWLSKHLLKLGFKAVSADISSGPMKSGKKQNRNLEFILCDLHNLPFKNSAFDTTFGIAILHHLRPYAIAEIGRVTSRSVLFMEPNLLNPLSNLGRRCFPTELHTAGEKPFMPSNLYQLLRSAGFEVTRTWTLFLLSFAVARLVRVLKARIPTFFLRFLSLIERFAEGMPLLHSFNSTVVAYGVKQ